MVFILGIALGVNALMLRSFAVIAGVALLILAVFTVASISLGTFDIVPLLLALVGYNSGILAGFVAVMTAQKFKASLNSSVHNG